LNLRPLVLRRLHRRLCASAPKRALTCDDTRRGHRAVGPRVPPIARLCANKRGINAERVHPDTRARVAAQTPWRQGARKATLAVPAPRPAPPSGRRTPAASDARGVPVLSRWPCGSQRPGRPPVPPAASPRDFTVAQLQATLASDHVGPCGLAETAAALALTMRKPHQSQYGTHEPSATRPATRCCIPSSELEGGVVVSCDAPGAISSPARVGNFCA